MEEEDWMNQDKKYQIWLRGSTLVGHVRASSKTEAMRKVREMLLNDFQLKRLPAGTCVCPISEDYYDQIAKLNREAGFNAMTDF
jgi:ribosomal protein L2